MQEENSANQGEEALQEMVQWVVAQFERGLSAEQIVEDLCGQGIPRDQAAKFVAGVGRARASAAQKRPWAGLTPRGFQFLFLIGAYAVVNAVLYFGQEIMKRDEVTQAEAIEQELDRLEQGIQPLDIWLEQKAEESAAIDELGLRLDQADQDYTDPDVYELDLARYNRQVEEWNAGVAELESTSATRDSLAGLFNARLEEYRPIAKRAYARWWLVPLPFPGRASRAIR